MFSTHLVPLPVVYSHARKCDTSLPASKVKPVSEHPARHLQDAVVDGTPGEHDVAAGAAGLETQTDAQMALDGPERDVLCVALSRECHWVNDVAPPVLSAAGDVHVAEGTSEALGAAAGVTLEGAVGETDLERKALV
jgi:hypothetical protein